MKVKNQILHIQWTSFFINNYNTSKIWWNPTSGIPNSVSGQWSIQNSDSGSQISILTTFRKMLGEIERTLPYRILCNSNFGINSIIAASFGWPGWLTLHLTCHPKEAAIMEFNQILLSDEKCKSIRGFVRPSVLRCVQPPVTRFSKNCKFNFKRVCDFLFLLCFELIVNSRFLNSDLRPERSEKKTLQRVLLISWVIDWNLDIA